MANVNDVAAYIINRTHTVSCMKLQKLVYYSQAWHMVWTDRPLFNARIEAWANGPVCPVLYQHHRGKFSVGSWPAGDSKQITQDEAKSIDSVLEHYGNKTAGWLSELSHMEHPWRDARCGLDVGERGNNEISQSEMHKYYLSLV